MSAPVRTHALKVEDGRLVLPREALEALDLQDGDTVILRQDADGLHLDTAAARVARAQVMFRRLVPAGRSLADELVAERREQAARGE